VALAVAHLSSEVMKADAELQRPSTGQERRTRSRTRCSPCSPLSLLVLVLGIGWRSSIDERSTVTVLVRTRAVALVGLAGWAGCRAGLRGWYGILAVLSGGSVGLLVISLPDSARAELGSTTVRSDEAEGSRGGDALRLPGHGHVARSGDGSGTARRPDLLDPWPVGMRRPSVCPRPGGHGRPTGRRWR